MQYINQIYLQIRYTFPLSYILLLRVSSQVTLFAVKAYSEQTSRFQCLSESSIYWEDIPDTFPQNRKQTIYPNHFPGIFPWIRKQTIHPKT